MVKEQEKLLKSTKKETGNKNAHLEYNKEREVDTRMVLNHNLVLDRYKNLDAVVPRTVAILGSNDTHDRA